MSDNSILGRYRKELEFDKKNENYDLPKSFADKIGSKNNEMCKEIDKKNIGEYKKKLDELRNSSLDMENQYKAAMVKIKNFKEEDLLISNCIKHTTIDKIMVKHAYCPECGKELVNKYPPMFNPFTHEKQCIHECECGLKYNLEYSYPRIAFYDANNNEIFAHCE